MDWTFLLTTLALVPYFTSRAAVPLFATAALARLGPEWSWLGQAAGIDLLAATPDWATSNRALAVLGGLALLEVAARKLPELRELLSLGDAEVKGLVVLGLCVALAAGVSAAGSPADPAGPAGAGVSAAGIGEGLSWVHAWALVLGATTWFLASVRRGLYGFLAEVDEDDDLGLQGLLSWAEDGIGFLGVLFAVVLPALALAVTALTLLGLLLARWWLARREEGLRVPCETCGEAMVPCGVHCPACGGRRSEPSGVGLLGTLREEPAPDVARHVLSLRAAKRCHRCGERLRERGLDQRCAACGEPAFGSTAELEVYLGRVQEELPRTLLVLFVLGAVPVLGLVPGIVYYRLTLISALRCYLPRSARFTGRWLARGINLVLLCLQPVPVLGAFVLPLMALTNYGIYRRSLRRQGEAVLGVPAAAGA